MKERGEGKTSRMVALSGSVQGQQATKGKSWEREREREREMLGVWNWKRETNVRDGGVWVNKSRVSKLKMKLFEFLLLSNLKMTSIWNWYYN